MKAHQMGRIKYWSDQTTSDEFRLPAQHLKLSTPGLRSITRQRSFLTQNNDAVNNVTDGEEEY